MVRLDQSGAAKRLSATALKYAKRGELDRALRSLNKAVDVIASCAEYLDAATAATFVLSAANAIGSDVEELAQRGTYELYRRIAFILGQSKVEMNTFVALHAASKGANFGSMLRSGYAPARSDMIETLLRDVRQSEERLPGPLQEPKLPNGAETAALFYAGSHEVEDANDPSTRHRNLQRRVDQEITAALYSKTLTTRWRLPNVREIQDAIPGDTVLISLLLGEGYHPSLPNAMAAVQGFALTCETIDFRTSVSANVPGGLVELRRGSQILTASPAIAEVDVLRRAVFDDPLHRRLTPEAEYHLKSDAQVLCAGFLRSTRRWLSEGKRHLMIWPNGPLHFVPFHLFMNEGWTVADDWTVTQIATLALIHR